MERLLNDANEDGGDDARRVPLLGLQMEVKRESDGSLAASPMHMQLPRLATQLAAPSDSNGGAVGLHMLSVTAPSPVAVSTPPRLPPISLLTAAATALQPAQYQQYGCFQPPPMQMLSMHAPSARLGVLSPSASARSVPSSMCSTPSSSSPASAEDELLCRYRNKKCSYPRAIKRNGDRHNLCERHRAKANQNQRKLESKRRSQKRVLARDMQMQASNGNSVARVAKSKKVAACAKAGQTFMLYGSVV